MEQPLITLLCKELPPKGKPRSGNMKTYPLSSACADTFPEGESKGAVAHRRGKQGGGSAPMGKARGVSTL